MDLDCSNPTALAILAPVVAADTPRQSGRQCQGPLVRREIQDVVQKFISNNVCSEFDLSISVYLFIYLFIYLIIYLFSFYLVI